MIYSPYPSINPEMQTTQVIFFNIQLATAVAIDVVTNQTLCQKIEGKDPQLQWFNVMFDLFIIRFY